MIIELATDVQVRVPDERLPEGLRGPIFESIKKGTKVNYAADMKSGLHKFYVYTHRYGILYYACTVEPTRYPEWV
jgi:hypothetical protein